MLFCVTIFVKGWPKGEEVYGPFTSVDDARKAQNKLVREALWLGFERRAIKCAVRPLYKA